MLLLLVLRGVVVTVVFVAVGAGFALRSTTGLVAEVGAGAAGAGAGFAATGAGARVTVLVATCVGVTGAGAAVRVTCRVVRATCVAGALLVVVVVDVDVVVLVSVAGAVVSTVVAFGSTLVVGAVGVVCVAGAVLVVAVGSGVVLGVTCCASSGVEESARAAAIAGRALALSWMLFLIMRDNARPRAAARRRVRIIAEARRILDQLLPFNLTKPTTRFRR
jgi:hypothetical protein